MHIKSNTKDLLINEQIKFPPQTLVRVIGPDNEQLGMLSVPAAQRLADEKGYDLVLIAQNADSPVCRIMDYGKYRFERDKREKEAKKKQQIVEIKEIQLSCLIDTNDFNTKVTRARRFLTDGNKVKVVLKFRGRQMSHQDIGKELLQRFQDACADVGTVDKAPVLENRFMTVFINPMKAAPAKKQEKPKEKEKETETPAPEEGN